MSSLRASIRGESIETTRKPDDSDAATYTKIEALAGGVVGGGVQMLAD